MRFFKRTSAIGEFQTSSNSEANSRNSSREDLWWSCWYASADQSVFQVPGHIARRHSIVAPTHRRPDDCRDQRGHIAFVLVGPHIARPPDRAVARPGLHRVVVLL